MVCFVLPTLNEAENISRILNELLKLHPNARLIVIDDNSTDNTAHIVRQAFRSNPAIEVIQARARLGLGGSLRLGVNRAKQLHPEFIITIDADGSHEPGQSLELLQAAKHVDTVVGSRYMARGSNGQNAGLTWYRFLISKLGNSIFGALMGIPIKDVTSGYRCYRTAVFDRLDIDALRSNEYNFQIEILYHLFKNGHKIKEVPIRFGPRIGGQSKFSFRQIIFSASTLLRLFIKGNIKPHA